MQNAWNPGLQTLPCNIYIYIYIYIFTKPSARAGYDTRSIFKLSLPCLNSEISFSKTTCLTKAEELSLPYYLPIAGGGIIGFIPFPGVLVLCEMQSVSSRIWTRVADIYIYIIYMYGVPSISFQTFLYRYLKLSYVIAIHLMRWLTNFYDFTFKWTATAAIGIHPTKAWLSQLVNFKNAIWTWGNFKRTICNRILF